MAAALILTGLNALKPPCIDDPAYLAVARQIASRPLDPYGFDQFWYQEPQPANEVLAPPVLPYWLALGMRTLGDEPVRLKLWLFPIALLLTYSFQSLFRRFAPGLETHLLLFLSFSPSILPAFNFMLDLPALALGLASLRALLAAIDRASWRLALLAGLLAGLAAQTKYTGAVYWPLLGALAVVYRRPAMGIAAIMVAATVFAGWEAYVYSLYGDSHFELARRSSEIPLEEKLTLPYAGLHLVGALASPLLVLAVASSTRKSLYAGIAGIVLLLGVAAVAFVPDTRNAIWLRDEQRQGFGFSRILFDIWGCLFLAVIAMTCAALGIRSVRPWRFRWSRPTTFLVAWLALEIAGYFVLTPFPAARRMIGVVVSATFILGHWAAIRFRNQNLGPIWISLGCSASLGLLVGIIDLADSRLEPTAVRVAVTSIREREGNSRIWYVGHWGTQYEAERLGLNAMIPNRSLLNEGDWLIDPGEWVVKQDFNRAVQMGEPEFVVRSERRFRLRTLPPYYGGGHPLEWWPDPAIEMRIYRIRGDWRPR